MVWRYACALDINLRLIFFNKKNYIETDAQEKPQSKITARQWHQEEE